MARNARKNITGNYFHVMVQGVGREYIFPDDKSKAFYMEEISKAKPEYNVKLFAFCIMGNHAHLLIKVQESKDMSMFFKKINEKYAKYYNDKTNRAGHVFRERYKCEVIEDEKYLVNCLVYIHNNPIKVHLAENKDGYTFSSLTNYLMQKGIVDFNEAKNYFDISPENMLKMLEERYGEAWIEHDDRIYESKDDVLQEFLLKNNITVLGGGNIFKKSPHLTSKIAAELKEKCGLNQKQIANFLEIDVKTLRKLCN